MLLRSKILSLIFGLTAVLAGCEKRTALSAPQPFSNSDTEYVLAVVLDLSGSFADQMAQDGRGYAFFMRLTEKFFRQRLGSNDRILITQLSGDRRTLLWEGRPASLKNRFPDSRAFSEFLAQNSSSNGSRVYSAMADTLNYVSNRPDITENTVLLTVVLSDLINASGDNSEQEKQALQEALQRYRERNGYLGLYWVDQDAVTEWNQILDEAGFPSRVWLDIVEDPDLPEFDY